MGGNGESIPRGRAVTWRSDGRSDRMQAMEAMVPTEQDASEALTALKESRIDGAGVLLPGTPSP